MDNDLKKRLEDLRRLSGEVSAICKKESEDRAAFEEKAAIEKEEFKERIAIEKRKFEEKISNDEKEFVRAMHSLRRKQQPLINEYFSLLNCSVSVRLGDLIDELVNLTDIDVSNVMINANAIQLLSLPGDRSEEISKLLDTTYSDSRFNRGVLISGKGPLPSSLLFCYLIKFNSRLSDVQADGKTLLEHCVVDVEYDLVNEKYYTKLNIKDNIDDLILRIPLSKLASDPNQEWYPADLMTQAVINCVEKSQEKEVSKKRSRKLSDETNK